MVAFTSPPEWRASNALVSMNSGGAPNFSSLGGIANLAGLDLGGYGGQEINPLAYQDILGSSFFIHQLVQNRFYSINLNDSITLFDYQRDHMKSGAFGKLMSIPGAVLSLFSSSSKEGEGKVVLSDNDSSFFYLSLKDYMMYNELTNRLVVSYDKIKSTLSLSFKHQDPFLAAQAIEFASDYLDSYIENFEYEEQQKRYKFIKSQIKIRGDAYDLAELNLSDFRDRNISLSTNRARSKEDELQAKRDLAFNLYSGLQKNLQELEIDLASKQTNLKPLGKTQIPVIKASTSKKVILLLYFMTGLFLSSGFLIAKHILIPVLLNSQD